ncbi:MAG: XRE family transcriptional regulator [Candidatus Aminicenantes bacterium]|jgi:Zn-dependent peptidase ImmA (M78 family)/transcriptional regulator with XRE-family HTH domain
MDIQKELANRLKNERDSLDFTLKEVSDRLGFNNYQTLSSIEAGEREVKAWELAKLASIYGRDIDYFLNFESPQKDIKILWRSPEISPQKKIIERQFISVCTRYQNLLKILSEPKTINSALQLTIDKNKLLSQNAFKYVENLATSYIRILKLGSRPSCSLAKILEEEMDIKIIFIPMDFGISGGSTKNIHFGLAILINANDAPWRRNFDLAHELFHLLTWEHFDPEEVYQNEITGKNRIEQLAEVFASSLLLPEDEVRNEFEKRAEYKSISYLNLVDIARDFDVSIEALLWRLVNLDLLKKEKIQEELESGMIKDIDKKHRKADWAEAEKPHLSPKYVSLAIKAFHMGKISKGKLAEYVGEKYSAIPSFLRRYGYDENEDYSVAYRTS